MSGLRACHDKPHSALSHGGRGRFGGVMRIAIHRKPHTVLRRLTGHPKKMAKPFFRETRAVQPRTVFSGAPCLKFSADDYNNRPKHTEYP